LKGFSRLQLSIKQATELAGFRNLYQVKWKTSFDERIFNWLENSITLWKNQGVSIDEGLTQIIEQLVAQRELVLDKISSGFRFLMFLISAVFGLMPFFYTVFGLILSHLSL
jgi:hypothetical protein